MSETQNKEPLFEQIAVFLQKSVPPDDIYLYAANLLFFGYMFCAGWRENKNYAQETAKHYQLQESAKHLNAMLAAFYEKTTFRVNFIDENNNTGSTDTPSPA